MKTQKNKPHIWLIAFFFWLVLSFILGFSLAKAYDHYYLEKEINNQVKIKGVWIQDAKLLSKYKGSYICVNIDETKTLKELTRICQHEIGHEIFARQCEKDINKCLELENE